MLRMLSKNLAMQKSLRSLQEESLDVGINSTSVVKARVGNYIFYC